MKVILLSFDYDVFLKLKAGKKKIEYRKHFPSGDVKAYFYVCRPMQAISGMAHFGKKIPINDLLLKCPDDKKIASDVKQNRDYCNYAVPIIDFQLTNEISLDSLIRNLDRFVIPRMYYYIDDTELLAYLDNIMHPEGNLIKFEIAHYY